VRVLGSAFAAAPQARKINAIEIAAELTDLPGVGIEAKIHGF